jgi:hypothetical protein
MNRKLWKSCIIGLLLFDLFLFTLPADLPSGCGKYLLQGTEGHTLQTMFSGLVSADNGYTKGQVRAAGNLSATAVLLLTLLIL